MRRLTQFSIVPSAIIRNALNARCISNFKILLQAIIAHIIFPAPAKMEQGNSLVEFVLVHTPPTTLMVDVLFRIEKIQRNIYFLIDLTDPVDIYCEWRDECEKLNS